MNAYNRAYLPSGIEINTAFALHTHDVVPLGATATRWRRARTPCCTTPVPACWRVPPPLHHLPSPLLTQGREKKALVHCGTHSRHFHAYILLVPFLPHGIPASFGCYLQSGLHAAHSYASFFSASNLGYWFCYHLTAHHHTTPPPTPHYTPLRHWAQEEHTGHEQVKTRAAADTAAGRPLGY